MNVIIGRILILGIIALPIIWFITDPRPLKERLAQYFTIKALTLLFIQYALIYLNAAYKNTLSISSTTEIFTYLGVALFFIGMIISIWAKLTMGEVWGRPGQHNVERQNKLITSGPFRFSRNPIYLGLVLIYLGYSLALQSIFIFLNIFLIGFFFASISKEEKLLEKHFDKEYLLYKKKVRRFI